MVIVILCPYKRATGGIELAHQLCYAINSLTDIRAYMWYTDIDTEQLDTFVVDAPTPIVYAAYKTECIKGLEELAALDSEENVVIFPEGVTNYVPVLDHVRKVLWWMSVDNYVSAARKASMDVLASEISLHLYQSQYSKEYVEGKIPDAKGMFLSDYINEEFGKFLYPAEFRQNLAFYNPRKGYKNIEPLIHRVSWLNWIPLQGLTREKIIFLLQCGKIYVDFGNHPGKDRIPREAAACGCCVITNMEGSAAYHEDVPIPDKYKFRNTNNSLDEIEQLMHDICDNFAQHQKNFEEYRRIINSEKDGFDEATIEFVNRMKGVDVLQISDSQVLSQEKIDGKKMEQLREHMSVNCPSDFHFELGDFSYYNTIHIKDEIKDGSVKVRVGKFCSIGSDVQFLLGVEHHMNWNSTYPFKVMLGKNDGELSACSKGDIVVGNDVWLGDSAVILSGVEIGDGCVIGAHAVVSKSVEPYSVVVGNPGRVVKMRFSKVRIDKLIKMKWWDWKLEDIYEAERYLESDDIDGLYDYWKEHYDDADSM